mgnify:CR=1 FL=1
MSRPSWSTEQCARKDYRCSWCGQKIAIGQIYVRFRGKAFSDDKFFRSDFRHTTCTPEAIERRSKRWNGK